MRLLSVLLVLVMALTTSESWAKRLAEGASVGKQSGQVQRSTTATAAPSSAAGSSAGAATSGLAPSAVSKPWGAVLGGVAAGLGLAWLASSLGMGEAFAHVLLGLLVLGMLMGLVGWWVRRRTLTTARSSAPPFDAAHAADWAYQGGTAGTTITPRSYSPQNVGNDASARPWERQTTGFEASRYSDAVKTKPPNGMGDVPLLGGGLSAMASVWAIPADFDVEGFLQASKTNFVKLQAAWDSADVPRLRAMMTDEMLAQIKTQLADRERQHTGVANVTDVVMLEARLLGIEQMEHEYMASVEFSGLIREEPSAGPSPFREIWNITRSKTGQIGWLVAGVQALQ